MRASAVAYLVIATGCQRATAADRARSGEADRPAHAAAAPSGVGSAPARELRLSANGPGGESPPVPVVPFGPPAPVTRYTCPLVQRGGPFRSFLAVEDTRIAFVDGDDPMALVNRSPTGALAPDYAPTDLVDLKDGRPRRASECDGSHECLRAEAAAALHRMLDAMHEGGMEGRVQSAFRSFGTQCWVFASWAHEARGGFCEATEQSALPGHSQHQLGTTLDLFTREWAEEGAKRGQGVFRDGFGCTRGGAWLDDTAWRFGFVVSYPVHPDDRREGAHGCARADRLVPLNPKTGYRSEPWHLRFVGVDAAARYHDAWLASGPGSPGEITLEQWLRGARGLAGDAELPVCDGCQCGACATLAADDAHAPCGKASLHLEGNGRILAPAEAPSLSDARIAVSADGGLVVEAVVYAPPHTPTQPPLFDANSSGYDANSTYLAVAPVDGSAARAYRDLPGAWRVAVAADPPTATPWPWRASLAAPELAPIWNRANVVLPAKPGESRVRVRVVVPEGARGVTVALWRDGEVRDAHAVALPP